MDDELIRCYRLLGLTPGAAPEELKAAHRDLAKVWHPDRFLHDPRLQQKAQEKLKEINEAYDQLRSGKAQRRTPPPAAGRDSHTPAQRQNVNVGVAPMRWQLILASVLIFAVAFLVASRSLFRPGEQADQSQIPAIEEVQNQVSPEQQESASRVNTPANELPAEKDGIEAQSPREESQKEKSDASSGQSIEASFRPLTVTIVIDPTNGMIARPTCPMKSRMTYARGNEPHQYCTSHPASPPATADAFTPKDSRLKSAAKRLTSPGKWFGGNEKAEAGSKQDSKTP